MLSFRRSLAIGGWPSALYPAALALGVLLPFAAIPPVVTTPWLALTDDKLVFVALVGAWLLQGRGAIPTLREWRALLPSFALILVVLISARLAVPDYADEALRFASRLAAAVFAMLVALRLGRNHEHARGLLWSLAIGAGLSAILGVGEAVRWEPLQPLLALFKVAPTRVGGELRVGASFQYATIAAMYFEMVIPLAIVLAATARRPAARVLGGAIAVMCTANVVLTLTRAGMLTLFGIIAALLLAATLNRTWRSLFARTVATVAVLLGGVALLLWRDPVFNMRLVTESDADWYGAMYSAPAILQLQPNREASVDLDVENQGRITWTSTGNHPFALGYRWLTSDGTGVLELPPAEVALPRDVGPGETIHLQASVSVPNLPAGTYRLDWGMLQRDVLQFYERGWADAETVVQIGADSGANSASGASATERAAGASVPGVSDTARDAGASTSSTSGTEGLDRATITAASGMERDAGTSIPDESERKDGASTTTPSAPDDRASTTRPTAPTNDASTTTVSPSASDDGPSMPGVRVRDDAEAPWVVGRLELWTVALKLFAQHPLLGVGPDNFRHYYGAELGLDAWDERIQANNLYLELLADLGVLGLAAFAFAVVGPLRNALRATNLVAIGLALGIGAFLLHGMLDSFLAFMPTAVLFWLLLGLADAQKPQVSGR